MSGVSRRIANSFANGRCDAESGSFTDGDKIVYGQTTLVRRVKEGEGTFEINATDQWGQVWATKTTLCRINAALKAVGCDKKVHVRRGDLCIDGEPWDGAWKVIA